MTYEEMAPQADKLLKADGAVATSAGEPILPPDPARAAQFEAMSPRVDKILRRDGSVVDSGGAVIEEASESGVALYASMSPRAAKWLLRDGSIVEELDCDCGPTGPTGPPEPPPESELLKRVRELVLPDGLATARTIHTCALPGGFVLLSGGEAASEGVWELNVATNVFTKRHETGYSLVYTPVAGGCLIGCTGTWMTGVLFYSEAERSISLLHDAGTVWRWFMPLTGGCLIGSGNTATLGILFFNETTQQITRVHAAGNNWRYGVEVTGGFLIASSSSTVTGILLFTTADRSIRTVHTGGFMWTGWVPINGNALISNGNSNQPGLLFYNAATRTVVSRYATGFAWRFSHRVPGGLLIFGMASAIRGALFYNEVTNAVTLIGFDAHYLDSFCDVPGGTLMGSASITAAGFWHYNHTTQAVTQLPALVTFLTQFVPVPEGALVSARLNGTAGLFLYSNDTMDVTQIFSHGTQWQRVDGTEDLLLSNQNYSALLRYENGAVTEIAIGRSYVDALLERLISTDQATLVYNYSDDLHEWVHGGELRNGLICAGSTVYDLAAGIGKFLFGRYNHFQPTAWGFEAVDVILGRIVVYSGDTENPQVAVTDCWGEIPLDEDLEEEIINAE